MKLRKHVLIVAAGALASVATLFVPTAASAASNPTALPAGQFTLASDYHRYDALNAALVGKLGTAAVHTVMDKANHDRTGITDSLGIAGYQTGFKFDSGDN